MINPIFFPFTHMQVNDVTSISVLFKSVFFFPTAKPDEFEKSDMNIKNKDFILPLYSENQDFDLVLHKVDEYRRWGELNKENRGNLKVFLQDMPYFTDDTNVVNIRTEIKKTSKESSDSSSKKEDLLKTLMFLRLAKIYDIEKENLHTQFSTIEKDEQKIFSAINGLDGLDKEVDKIKVEDIGEYMTSKRISAWVNYFNRRKPFNTFDTPLLFVTTSSAVMEYLISVSKNKIKLLDIDKLKVHENKCENKKQWVEEFNKYVEEFVTSGQQPLNTPAERDDNCTLEVKIKLYLLQGDVISSFFQGIGQNIPVCLVSV